MKYLDTALFTVVGIVAFEEFAFDKLLERIDQIVALDRQIEGHENLLPLVAMWAFLADHLVAEDAAEKAVEQLFAFDFEEVLVDAVYQVCEELERVLLLAHVDRLATQPETTPELLRNEVLKLRFLEMSHDHLKLEEERLLVSVFVVDS